MHVLKFGGSSVGNPARIRQVMDIVVRAHARHRNLIVVFSAFQGITDQLITLSRQAAAGDRKHLGGLRVVKRRHLDAVRDLLPARARRRAEAFVRPQLDDLSNVVHGVSFTKELTARTLDYIMSFGEVLSSFIIAEALRARRVPCTYTDSRQLIKADDTFGAGRVKYDVTYHTIRSYFRKHRGLHVVPGFIASTMDNDTVTLGRGGSDFTASLYGAALEAQEIEIWTDVDGVMTADPRKVEKAFSIPRMTYQEAMEMSHFGAKIIHPPTLQPALTKGIPLRIKNTFRPEFAGTLIGADGAANRFAIRGISSIDEIALLRVQGGGLFGVAGIGKRIFTALASRGINVFLTTQASSEYSLCMAVLPDHAQAAKQVIEEELRYEIRDHAIDEVLIESGLSAIAVVGENMRRTTGVAGRLFQALGKNGINVVAIAQGSSELNISTVVSKADEAKALNALHEAFFLSGTTSLNLFIVGTGLIGGTLFRQIAQQRQMILHNRNLDVRVQAVANSRKMVFHPHGIPPHLWQQRMEEAKTPMKLGEFIRTMKAMNLPNSVFVDCTPARELVECYEEVLASSISIVTPNKTANAAPLAFYGRLREIALKHNARFLYETNVGAGLPIINTIQDLVAGGDRILRIDGVLSGSLSYILNAFSAGGKLSECIRDAFARGYMEPDPRDDLSGLDAGRKILILAREAGAALERRHTKVRPLLPASFSRGGTVEEFLRRLPKMDARFDALRRKAADEGKLLRYVASWQGREANVALQAVTPDHPAASLRGSDVTVALTTTNCREHPVIITGPGAGADVTATGVLADIIRAGRHSD
jgi:aspartokinase/homoserine dehydrogenase 1